MPEEDDWIFSDPSLALNQPNNHNNIINNNVINNNNNGNTADASIAPQTNMQTDSPLQNVVAELDSDTPRARNRSPERFEDKSGSRHCDWCKRAGHEAIDCIRWDPEHFDKAVCVACNNARHGIDECPKFHQMGRGARADLLLARGARRPGVRSRHHAWPAYCTIDYWGPGFPMTRAYLRGLAGDEKVGPMLRNVWKIWDYRRSLPAEFRDPDLDDAITIALADLDERFEAEQRPSGDEEDGSAASMVVGEGEGEVGDDAEGEDAGDDEVQV